MAGTGRTKREIEIDLYKVLREYLAVCQETSSYSFQGAVSEMAWDIENNIEDITEDVC